MVDLGQLRAEITVDGVAAAQGNLRQYDQAVNNTAQNVERSTQRMGVTWRQFVQERMSDYMKLEGGHAGAMQRISAEWRQYKASGSTAAASVASATETAQSRIGRSMQQVESLMMSADGATGTMAAGIVSLNGLLAVFGATFTVAGIVSGMEAGIKAIDSFKVSVIQIAAQLTQLQGPTNVAEHYKASVAYANALAEKMQEIDANSFANNQQLMVMLQTMIMQGQVLDINNKKQIEAFTALSNAIAMYTVGENQQVQAAQEMRALMTGQIDQHSLLSRALDAAILKEGVYKGGLKEIVELGQHHGDLLERLQPYLVGINAASSDINKTWSAVSSSMETAVNKVIRAGFAQAFADIVPKVSEFANWLKDSSLISELINKSMLALKGVIETITNLCQGPLSVILTGIGGLTMNIINAWGLLLYAVLPVLTDEFNHLLYFLNAMVNLAYSFGLVMLDAVGAVGSALLSVGKAALQALTGDFEGAGKTLQEMFSGVYVERFKENMVVAKGATIAITEEWKAMQDPMGRVLDRANQFLAKMDKVKESTATKPQIAPTKPEAAAFDMEAYEKEAERWRELDRALRQAYDKQALTAAKNEADLELQILRNRHDLGLISEQQYLDDQHKAQVEASNREIFTLENAAMRAQNAYEDALKNPSYLNRPADGAANDLIDRYNKAVEIVKKTEKEMVDAWTSVANAEGKAAVDAEKFSGASSLATIKSTKDQLSAQVQLYQALGDTTIATQKQIELDKQNRLQLDDAAKKILEKVDALKKLKAAFDDAHANDDLIDRIDSLNVTTDPYASQMAAIEQRYKKEMQWAQELKDKKKQLGEDTDKEDQRLSLLAQARSVEEANFKKQVWINEVKSLAASLDQIGQALMTGSKKQFELGKKLAIASTIISTYQSAQEAFTSLAGIPLVGPVLGGIAATAAVVAGLARVDQIRSQNFEASYAVGTDYVPRDQVAQIHEGEMVIDRASADALRKYGININLSTAAADNYGLNPASDSLTKFAEAVDNASLSVRRIADGFTKVQGSLDQLFTTVQSGTTDKGFLPGIGAEKFVSDDSIMSTLSPSKLKSGSLYGAIFGFGNEWEQFSKGVALWVQAGQVTVDYFSTMRKGGSLFGGPEYKTSYSPADPKFVDQLNSVITKIQDAIASSAAALNITESNPNISMTMEKLNFKGKTADQAQKLLEDWLTKYANTLSDALGGRSGVLSDLGKLSSIDNLPVDQAKAYVDQWLTNAQKLTTSTTKTLNKFTSSIEGINTSKLSDAAAQKKLDAWEQKFLKTITDANGHVQSAFAGFESLDLSNLSAAEAQAKITEYLSSVQSSLTATNGVIADFNADFDALSSVPADQLKDKLSQFIAAVNSQLTGQFDDLTAAALPGEKSYDTLIRLVSALQAVNDMAEMTGGTLLESSIQGAEAASQLVESMGGMDKFKSALSDYMSAIYTDDQRTAMEAAQAQRDVNNAFRDMGAAVPETRDQFAALVNGLDLSTDSGRQMYASLLEIAPAFGKVQDAAEKAAKAAKEQAQWNEDLQVRLLRAKGNDTAADSLELQLKQQRELQDAIDKGYDTGLLQQVQLLERQQSVTSTARSNYIDALKQEHDTLASTRDQMQQFAASLKQFRQGLLVGSSSPLSPQDQYAEAAKQFDSIAAKAKLGDVDALGQLQSAASAFLDASRGYNASGPQYATDFQHVMDVLQLAEDTATRQASNMDQQISLLQQQLTALGEVNQSVLSVADALAAYQTAQAAAGVTGVTYGTGGGGGLPITPIPAFADGGLALPGLALVGEEGPELVRFRAPGRVYTAAETQAALAGSQSSEDAAALREEVKALREEVAALTSAVAYGFKETIAADKRTAENTDDMVTIMRREAAA